MPDDLQLLLWEPAPVRECPNHDVGLTKAARSGSAATGGAARRRPASPRSAAGAAQAHSFLGRADGVFAHALTGVIRVVPCDEIREPAWPASPLSSIQFRKVMSRIGREGQGEPIPVRELDSDDKPRGRERYETASHLYVLRACTELHLEAVEVRVIPCDAATAARRRLAHGVADQKGDVWWRARCLAGLKANLAKLEGRQAVRIASQTLAAVAGVGEPEISWYARFLTLVESAGVPPDARQLCGFSRREWRELARMAEGMEWLRVRAVLLGTEQLTLQNRLAQRRTDEG